MIRTLNGSASVRKDASSVRNVTFRMSVNGEATPNGDLGRSQRPNGRTESGRASASYQAGIRYSDASDAYLHDVPGYTLKGEKRYTPLYAAKDRPKRPPVFFGAGRRLSESVSRRQLATLRQPMLELTLPELHPEASSRQLTNNGFLRSKEHETLRKEHEST